MKNTKKLIERRICKRFQVQEGAYVWIRNNSSKLGQIKNISRDGLAFMYIANGEQLHGSFEVNIFFVGHGFYLKDVPSTKISDFRVKSKLPFSPIIIRQIGVQFEELQPSQLSKLDVFIENHTMGEEV